MRKRPAEPLYFGVAPPVFLVDTRKNIGTKSQVAGQIMFGDEGEGNPIKVSIGQFYGIEINDFAVTVAKTALWIAESQMMKETEDIVHTSLDFLPLKSYANIIEGNALQLDWESVIPKYKLNYIMGNPPFIGYSLQSKEQKEDTVILCTILTGHCHKQEEAVMVHRPVKGGHRTRKVWRHFHRLDYRISSL